MSFSDNYPCNCFLIKKLWQSYASGNIAKGDIMKVATDKVTLSDKEMQTKGTQFG